MFYAEDGHIAGCNLIWVQKILMEVVCMFKSVGLKTNLGKKKVMVRTPGFIWRKKGE